MNDLEATRGDDEDYTITVWTDERRVERMDLTGAHVWVTIKRTWADPDELALAQLDNESLGGVTILTQTGVTKGQAVARVPSAATTGLPGSPQNFVFDVQVKDATGRVTTPARRGLRVQPDATIRTS